MDSGTAISVSNVSKGYRMWATPAQRLLSPLYAQAAGLVPAGRFHTSLQQSAQAGYKDFFALQDISFEVARGESLGIIGRNGSGKSTLLQIIAGTMQPTTGRVQARGRVAALLELGAGFNADFTGRENVYLNGAVLGLSKQAMEARFDDIAAFADIGDFLDQPVKTYSSGMALRLAFAVQTAVEPEVLIVDEALAVGDMFFQAKCMARLRKMISNGLTLLLVSHEPSTIKSLCSRGLLLEKGRLLCLDKADTVAERYFAMKVAAPATALQPETPADASGREPPAVNAAWSDFVAERSAFEKLAGFQRTGHGAARFTKVALRNLEGKEIGRVEFGQRCRLTMAITVAQPLPNLTWGIHVRDGLQQDVLYTDATRHSVDLSHLKAGENVLLECEIQLHLKEGPYSILVACAVPIELGIAQVEYCDLVPIACQFYAERPTPFPIYAPVLLQASVTGQRL